MAEELKIIIDADVSQATAGLNQFADTVQNKVVKPLKEIAPAANAGLNATAQQAKVVTIAVSNLGRTLDDLKQKVAGKQALISTERDVNNIAILNKEIQALEAEILRVQNIGKVGFNEFGRAVTDSSDKIVAGFGNAFGAIRRLAFILPGIGIAGIFDAAFTGFQKLVTALQSANFGVPKFKELISSIEGAKDEFVKASVAVDSLKDEIQLAKDGFISKDDVVKKYNETIGKTTGFVRNLDEAEVALNKNANAYIQFTLLKAAANVALGKSAEVAFQAALQNQKDLERISKITADKEGIGEFIKSGEENLRRAEQETFAKRVQSLKDIANNFLKEAAEIKKQFNFNFFDDNQKEKTVKSLSEIQRKIIELGDQAQKIFNVPLKLKFDSTDLDLDKFNKAKEILKEIEDHTIRLKVLPIDKIDLPKLQPEIDKPFFKKQFDDLVKGFTVPLQILLDQPSLLDAEDQIKQIFSGFSDTNIFTEFGRNAGNKFRDALLESIKVFNKGFTLNPNLSTDELITSLKEKLGNIKDIEIKIISTEDFKSALRTLVDLHDAGEAAGKAVEKAFIAAGKSSEEAAKAAQAIIDSYGGISQQTAQVAQAVDSTLTPAFQDLFSAILEGQDPLKAFFKGLGNAVDQLISKLIAAAIEAAILSAILPGGGGGFLGIFKGLLGFEKGGDPPINKPSIIGEKGWEIFVPKVPGTIISHEKSVQLLSNSVKSESVNENNSTKEYLLTTRINQAFKEHTSHISDSIKEGIKVALVPIHSKLSETIKSITTNNEKLTAYSYKLHEVNTNNIQSLKESFVKTSTLEKHFSEKETFQKLITSFKESFNQLRNNIESSVSNNTLSNILQRYENSTFERVNEKGFSSSSISNRSFNRITDSFTESKLINVFDKLKESFTTKDSFEKITSDIKSAVSLIDKSVTNSFTSKIEKLIEKISTDSKTIHIERVINNTIVKDNVSSFKEMSLTQLQKTFNIPAFASGGAVFGPTLAILGEGFGISRSNPEFVGTASQLKGIQGGAFDVNVNVNGDISFDMGKLAIALNREERSHFRTNGKKPF